MFSRVFFLLLLSITISFAGKNTQSFRNVVENFEQLSPIQMNKLLLSFNQTDINSLSGYPVLSSMMMIKICQINPKLVIYLNNKPTNCINAQNYLRQLLQQTGGNINPINQTGYKERREALFVIKCDYGENSKAVCENYLRQVAGSYNNQNGATMQMNNQIHNMNMGIINNMAGCQAGYYMQDGVCYPQ